MNNQILDDKPNIPLLVLTGPTAVGKTDLSLRLAADLNGSIISADSMQVYRHMNIGTAKLLPEEQKGIPHYLIDILDPQEDFNVADFQLRVKAAITEIRSQGRLPIMTGGTGFYIQAILRDVDFSESDGKSIEREQMEQMAAEGHADELYRRLQEVDPDSAEAIHPHNVQRVIRALEFYMQTGRKISEHNRREMDKSSPYRYCYFVLTDDRARLYDRINRRVDQMVTDGLEEEVKGLLEMGLTEQHVSMNGLGYKEWLPYFRGEQSREETIEIIKRDTRHFAKRQLTWFRREHDVIWINKQDFAHDEDRILAYIEEEWKKNGCNIQ